MWLNLSNRVRQSLSQPFLLLVLVTPCVDVLGDETQDPPPSPAPTESESDSSATSENSSFSKNNSPADSDARIVARTYEVQTARKSRSGRVYLFDTLRDRNPKVGKIILVKKELKPRMAFRVLRTYAEKKQFAAKRVKTYGEGLPLDIGESFTVIEKIAQVTKKHPITPQDREDLKEFDELASPTEGNAGTIPQQAQPDEDRKTEPPPSSPQGSIDQEAQEDRSFDPEEVSDDEELTQNLVIEEVIPIDNNRHWLTLGFGLLRNNKAYFTSAGGRYGISLFKMTFAKSARVQDSLALEGGVFLYRIAGLEVPTDGFSVMSIIGTLRYNLIFGETFGMFFYGGLVKNSVTSTSSTSSEQTLNKLAAPIPAAGGGMLFRVGPNWDIRFDAGLDIIGMGLMLRF